jgi:hypothetical protein
VADKRLGDDRRSKGPRQARPNGAGNVNLSPAGMAGYGRAARACLCTSATIALYGVITAVTKVMT